MTTIYISLGSNLQDPFWQIKQAVHSLDNLPLTNLIKSSKLYKTKPIGIQSQPDFLNAVVELATDLPPNELLIECQKIETQQGRQRLQKWGPRTIDLDILLYGNQIIQTDNLVIPHPEMTTRLFVLEPLCEIASDLILPDGVSVLSLLASDKMLRE